MSKKGSSGLGDGERVPPAGAVTPESDLPLGDGERALLERYKKLGTPESIRDALEVDYPEKIVGGEPNPAYIAAKLRELQQKNRWWLRNHQKPLPGFDSAVKAIHREAKFMGLDPEALDETKSFQERAMDLLVRAGSDPHASAILEETERVVMVLGEQMKAAVELVAERLAAEEAAVDNEARKQRLKRAHALGKDGAGF